MELLPHFLKDLQRELDECADSAPMLPSDLQRYFLLILRAHWSASVNFGPTLDERFKCLTWNPDPNSRQLDIELQGSPAVNRQHMIWVSIGNYRFKHVTFGKRSNEFEEDNSTERLVMPCSCQLLIRHEAPSLPIASDMAWTTLCFLLGFSEAILTDLGAGAAGFTPELLGEPQLKEQQPKDRIRVDVGARLDINLAVATAVESHRLKHVDFEPTETP